MQLISLEFFRLLREEKARAEKDEVANSDCYDVVIQAVVDLLPPDLSDLYPGGLPEGIEIDL